MARCPRLGVSFPLALAPRVAVRRALLTALGVAGLASAAPMPWAQRSFVNYENPPLHAVDLSPDGSTLAVVNLPDNRLELFDLSSGSPVAAGSVAVGLDPVSVRFRTNGEAWVVNHVSDSVSVVDLGTGRVRATLQTSDEPYDVVFAGSPARAFVSCSQANQVLVFDPASLALENTLDLVVEEPRSLAASPDGSEVYVAVFRSSNATTLISGGDRRNLIPNVAGGNAAGPLTGVPVFTGGPYGGTNPPPNVGGPTTATPTVSSFEPPIKSEYLPGGTHPAPPVALIVRKDENGQWFDDNGGDWSDFVSGEAARATLRVPGWDMPDRDVVVIDAATQSVVGYARSLMNTVMAVGVNPATGEITAVGTEGTNEIRFEPNVNSTFVRVQLGVVNAGDLTDTDVVDLNAGHLDYSVRNLPQGTRDLSVGDPRGILWNATGTRGYVAGMGSNNVIVIDPAGSRLGLVEVGEGPVALAIDEARQRLYVLDRFAATISVVSLDVPETVVETVPLHDPTPAAIRVGRRHLYDTHATSGLGQASCASCHIDARDDALSWDLGDPQGDMQAVVGTDVTEPINQPLPGANAHNLFATPGLTGFQDWHPMKGPMTTQTLQDIIGKEPFHHRGDKDGIEGFAGAYVSLQGDDAPLPPAEMQEFEDYLATITYPPNPFRNFDNTLSTNVPLPGIVSTGRYTLPEGAQLPNGNARHGFELYTQTAPGATRCVQCHTLPTGMTTHKRWDGSKFVDIPLGPNGESHLALRPDDTTIHRGNKGMQWRQLYEKVGTDFTALESKTGFGYMNDGREDTIVRRAMAGIFNFGSDQNVADFVALVFSFSGFGVDVNPNGSNTGNPPGPRSQDSHAAVGKQVTVADALPVPLFGQADAIESMIAFAEDPAGRTDLVVKGLGAGADRGWFYDRLLNRFLSDRDDQPTSVAALRAQAAPSVERTWTVVPRGSGLRIGIDRDEDGFGDSTEALAGSNPADPLDVPDDLRLAVALNGERFGGGDTLELTLNVAPGTSPDPVDVYVVLERPDGRLLFLKAGGAFTTKPTRMFTNWAPVASSTLVVSASLSGNEPPGLYTWHSRVYAPGTIVPAAGPSAAPFETNLD